MPEAAGKRNATHPRLSHQTLTKSASPIYQRLLNLGLNPFPGEIKPVGGGGVVRVTIRKEPACIHLTIVGQNVQQLRVHGTTDVELIRGELLKSGVEAKHIHLRN